MIKGRFVLTVLIPILLPPLQDPRRWRLSASLLLGITQRIPLNLTDIIDVDPCPSHIDRVPVFFF